jgi:hypothetical protein
MALWIFGDSFSVARENISNGNIEPWHLWHERLANNLGFSEYLNFAQWGVSNEFILEQFLKHQMEYNSGDHIIVQLTNSSRQWFIKDHPELSNFYVTDIDRWLTKEQVEAVNMYITHLHRDELDEMRYFMLVKTLERITQEIADCKILILPGFHKIPGVQGTLTDICNNEFVSDEARKQWYTKNIIDTRANHFSPDNHFILAHRITEFFQTGQLVNLLDGYKQGFL